MNKRKVLYFMPDNPLSGKAGNLTRAKFMLDFFKENSELEVDFFSVRDWGVWNSDTIRQFATTYPDIKLHLYNRKISKKKPLQRILGYKIPNFFHKLLRGTSIDISGFMLKRKMRKLIDTQKYDYVIISYAVWGSLVENVSHKPYLIVDTHDFITAQNRHKKHKIGKMFQSEMNILRKFDEIWTYSIEEEYIFQQFTDKKISLVPISFPLHASQRPNEHKYDVIYIASGNPHNVAGITWFITDVLPHLTDVKIHIAGKICNSIGDHPNIIKHGILDDLGEFYANAKIAICPMLSGTGIKIKVLEALSYGLPVVTNRRGVDGLVNKKENGCIVTDSGQQFAQNIEALMKNDRVYDQLSMQANNYIRMNHSLQSETEFLNKTFNS